MTSRDPYRREAGGSQPEEERQWPGEAGAIQLLALKDRRGREPRNASRPGKSDPPWSLRRDNAALRTPRL